MYRVISISQIVDNSYFCSNGELFHGYYNWLLDYYSWKLSIIHGLVLMSFRPTKVLSAPILKEHYSVRRYSNTQFYFMLCGMPSSCQIHIWNVINDISTCLVHYIVRNTIWRVGKYNGYYLHWNINFLSLVFYNHRPQTFKQPQKNVFHCGLIWNEWQTTGHVLADGWAKYQAVRNALQIISWTETFFRPSIGNSPEIE